jgi:hypothetical protein
MLHRTTRRRWIVFVRFAKASDLHVEARGGVCSVCGKKLIDEEGDRKWSVFAADKASAKRILCPDCAKVEISKLGDAAVVVVKS